MSKNPKIFKTRMAAALLFGASALILPLTSQAQNEADSWQWRASIYGWLPDLDGTTNFPTEGGGPDISIGVSDILDNLDMTFMGALHVNKGKWGVLTDVQYVDLGNTKQHYRDFTLGPNQRPGSLELDLKLDVKALIWTIGGTYRLKQDSRNTVDMIFGARMIDLTQELDWEVVGSIEDHPLPGRQGSSKVSGTNWDALIGLQGISRFGASGKWSVPWLVDVGTGDSDFMWEAMAGIGYSFGWGDMFLNYRYLDYDNGDSALESLTLAGPMIGASFSW